MIEPSTLSELLQKCNICRIGYYDDHEVYIVPLNFGYTIEDDKISLFFHGAKKGRRYELAHTHPQVGFELDTDYQLVGGKRAVDYTAKFKSLVGNGTLHLVEDAAAKEKAMQAIMAHYTGKPDWPIEERVLQITAIYQLEITKISYREH